MGRDPSDTPRANEEEYDDVAKEYSFVPGVQPHENAALDADHMSAWQCMRQNPMVAV
jgi:hypothetical protein